MSDPKSKRCYSCRNPLGPDFIVSESLGIHLCIPCSEEEPDEPDYDAYRCDDERPSYREAMKDAGRGHLLR